MHQLKLEEKLVYRSVVKRLEREYPQLDLKEVPCYSCFESISPVNSCDATLCPKLTAWLIALGGN